MEPDHDHEYLRAGQVGELLQVSAGTVAAWSKAGLLPFQRTLGGQRRYPAARIRALADALTEVPERRRVGRE